MYVTLLWYNQGEDMKFKIVALMSIALFTVTFFSILSPSQPVKALDYDWDNIRWAGNSAAYDDGALDATWR